MNTSDHEISQSANILVQQHGHYDALHYSTRRIAELKAKDDLLGVMVWQRITTMIRDKPRITSP